MAIFYTDTGSLSILEVTGSTLLSGSTTPLRVVGSGSNVMVVSGSKGALLELSEVVGSGALFTIASASVDVLNAYSKGVSINTTATDGTNPQALFVSGSNINVIVGESNVNTYTQLNIINQSSGTGASSDVVATNDAGTESGGYIDMGINSSTFAGTIGVANDAYLYATGSNLLIGNITRGNASLRLFSGNDATIFPIIVTGSVANMTGSLFGSSSYSLTASFALNAGGGAGFPYEGFAVITGSFVVTSGSGVAGTFLTASETLTAGDFINIGVGGVKRATNDDTSKQAHGFVSRSYSATNVVDVFYSGLNTGLTGLIPGSRYFLGTTGGETTTPPTSPGQISQEIGVAVTANAILVNIGPAIVT